MTDTSAAGPANQALAKLRAGAREGKLSSHVKVCRGIDLRADPALQLGGRYASPRERILELSAQPAGQGAWCGLHLKLPACDLRGYGALGFVLRGMAPQLQMLRGCVRSGTRDGFSDCFFGKHVLLRPEETGHADALMLTGGPQLPLQAPWRELVLFLPTGAFELTLTDWRVFLV